MLYLIFDNIRKPPNVGAAVRLAAATGFQLVFCGNSLPHTHRKCQAAAAGYADSVDVQYFNTLENCIQHFRERNISISGTSPYGTLTYWDIDFLRPQAIVFGNEATGLSKEKLAMLDQIVIIPMPGIAESLNLATSAAIISFEAVRQQLTHRGFSLPDVQGIPDRK